CIPSDPIKESESNEEAAEAMTLVLGSGTGPTDCTGIPDLVQGMVKVCVVPFASRITTAAVLPISGARGKMTWVRTVIGPAATLRVVEGLPRRLHFETSVIQSSADRPSTEINSSPIWNGNLATGNNPRLIESIKTLPS